MGHENSGAGNTQQKTSLIRNKPRPSYVDMSQDYYKVNGYYPDYPKDAKMSTNQTRKETLENLVVSILNENYETLGAFGDLDDFIEIVVQATEDWCLDCYQDYTE